MSPPSWRLVAPINYPGSANKVDGLPGFVGRSVHVMTDLKTRSPHSFACSNNTKASWDCACGRKGCPKNIFSRGVKRTSKMPLCTTC